MVALTFRLRALSMMKHALPYLLRSLMAALCLHALAGGAYAIEPALRFSRQFPMSSAMEERVRFWVRVFTEVSHTEAVLHDRDDPRIVYDVVPVGPSGSTGRLEAVRASYDHLLTSIAFTPAASAIAFVPPAPERVRVASMLSAAGLQSRGVVRAIGNIRAQRGLREVFADGLMRAKLYMPTIKQVFRDAKLPPELVYLPHVESSFNPNAVSKAGALGLWQFTRDTAEQYVKFQGSDPRIDPARSTQAAAAHLGRAFEVLGSWPLAIASYNHGVAGIARARADVGSDSLDDIIRGYDSPSFGFASQNFYAEFLAAVHVARNADYYFPQIKRTPVLQYVVRPGDSLWKIARKHQVTVRELAVANDLRRSPLRQGQRILIKRTPTARSTTA